MGLVIGLISSHLHSENVFNKHYISEDVYRYNYDPKKKEFANRVLYTGVTLMVLGFILLIISY